MGELLDLAGNREVSQPVPRLNGSLAQLKILLAGRIRHGRPLRLVLKLMIAATASALAVVSVG